MKFVVFLVILAGLVVGADFAFAAVAEHQVSQQARKKFELRDDPAVNIHGFPFTTQALSGDYGHITVSSAGVRVRDLRELEITADLYRVRAPLNDVLEGNASAMRIGTIDGRIKVKQSDLGRIIKLPTLTIDPAAEQYVRTGDKAFEIDPDKPEELDALENTEDGTAGIRLSADTEIAGTKLRIIAFALIELKGTSVRIEPMRLELDKNGDTTVVPTAVRELLLPKFQTTINPGSLPFNASPTGVSVERGALVVNGTASGVTFAGATR